MRRIIMILVSMFLLVGMAAAATNTYYQIGAYNYSASPTISLNNFGTSNGVTPNAAFDSSKISGFSIAVAPTYGDTLPTNVSGLVAYYKCDSSSGTTFVNESGTNGTVQANCTWATGKYNNGLYMNGSGTSASFGNGDPLFNMTESTLVVWVNRTAATASGGIFADDDGNTKIFAGIFESGNSAVFKVGDGTGTTSVTVANVIHLNSWDMYVLSYNATTGTMGYGVNTAYSTTTGLSYPRIGGIGSSHYTYLGYCYQNGKRTIGTYDSVQFYNRSLTQAELLSLYYNGLNETIQSNADASASSTITGAGTYNIPYSLLDSSVSSLNVNMQNPAIMSGRTVNDFTNTSSPFTYNVSITTSQVFSPAASFTASASTITRGSTVQFTDASTNVPTSYQWNFGDGTANSTSVNPTHTYNSVVSPAGATYTVTLTVSNAQGSSSYQRTITVAPANGDYGVLNSTKRIAVYLENTNPDVRPIAHDPCFTGLFREYNMTYLYNDTIAGNLSTANFDLLLTFYGFTNSTAQQINNFIASGGNVWFVGDPLNEADYYATNYTNVTYGLPANRFYCLGSLNQPNVTAGYSLTINNSDPAMGMLPSSYTALTTTYVYTNCRNFGGTYGNNSNGYMYDELVYAGTNCFLAKVWNVSTGSRVVYSNLGDFQSGGSGSYFNSTIGPVVFNNMKSWVLRLDNNTMQVSVTYPKGDKQFGLVFDDPNLKAPQLTPELDRFYNAMNSMAVKPGITLFVSPGTATISPGEQLIGYNYYTANCTDVATLHPHQPTPIPLGMDWSVEPHNGATETDYRNNMSSLMYNYTALGLSNPSFRLWSIRFPGTGTNNSSSLAAAQLNFKITSDYGSQTHMGVVGSNTYGNLLLPKQKILYEQKTNQIELECPTYYDLDEAARWDGSEGAINGSEGYKHYYTDNCNATAPFFGSGFTSTFTVNGHWQCAMTNVNYTGVVRDVLYFVDNNTRYTSFINLATLAQYEEALSNAQIKTVSSNNGLTTTTTVTTATPIVNFTVKCINITNGVHAQFDGSDLDASHVIYEDGVYFVYNTVPAGTHTLTVSDEAITGTYALYAGKNNAVSAKIKNSVYTLTNNACNVSRATLPTNNIYPQGLNGTNVISGSQNTLYIDNHSYTPAPYDFVVTPTGGAVNVTVLAWTDSDKVWKESSATHGTVTAHQIGGFPIWASVVIFKNGIPVGYATSDLNGRITYTYTGGYSDVTFEATIIQPIEVVVSPIINNTATTTDLLQIATTNVTGAQIDVVSGLYARMLPMISSGYSLLSVGFVILGAYFVMRYMGWL